MGLHEIADFRLRIADLARQGEIVEDRKSTRLNSSHSQISYAVFCLKKKNTRNANAAGVPVRWHAVLHAYAFVRGRGVAGASHHAVKGPRPSTRSALLG